MIDEKALGPAFEALRDHLRTMDMKIVNASALAKVIEGYEAARWRPIEEAQHAPKKALVLLWAPKHRHCRDGTPVFEEVGPHTTNYWREISRLPEYQGAVFRTIDPPPLASSEPAD